MAFRRNIVLGVVLILTACGGTESEADLGQFSDVVSTDTPALQDTPSSPIDSVSNDVAPADTSLPDTNLVDSTLEDLSNNDVLIVDQGSFDGSDPCLSDEEYFAIAIWEATLNVKCIVCHRETGIAKNSEMVLQGVDTPGFMEVNFETVKALALKEIGDQSTLLAKPTLTHPQGHTGGKQIEINGLEYLRFEHFIKRMKGEAGACDVPDSPNDEICEAIPVGKPMVRRLSHVEYDNTIQELFGFDSQWGASFTVDNLVQGFDNNSEALTVSPLLADQYRKAAEEIAAQAMTPPISILPCALIAGQEIDCVQEFIQVFGSRIFRRPISEDDLARYLEIYDLVADEDGTETGIQWVITALLQSPHFLYRKEVGTHLGAGEHALTGYEIASQLSYFFWNTMPDEELFSKAADGSLVEPATILEQAQRLLSDPRSHEMLAHFSRQWLDIANLGITPKDGETYPAFNDTVRESMAEETARFVEYVVFEGSGALPELFTAKYTLTNQTLADYYGFTSTGGASFTFTDLENSPYTGILTQGSVMTQHAFANSSSPIHRGVMVRERILCQELPPPPPGIIVQVPELDAGLTTRERFQAHSEVEPCTSCHQLIDPIGFAFENFDGVGLFRDEENGKPIDVTGEIHGSIASDATFNGVSELGDILGSSEDVQACFALHWYRFAYGLDESIEMHCLLRKVQDDFKAESMDIKKLMLNLTQTEHFVRRVGEEPEVPPDVTEDTADSGSTDGGAVSDEGVSDVQEPPTQPLLVETVIQSQWATGYCADIFVTNEGSETLQWEFTMTVDGEISSLWNANVTPVGDKMHFTGVDWNDTLAPGSSAQFGFCAAL
jgi:hypothetical protein